MSLSKFSSVIVGARISRSGEAMPRSGDLVGQVGPVDTGTGRLVITIDGVQPLGFDDRLPVGSCSSVRRLLPKGGMRHPQWLARQQNQCDLFRVDLSDRCRRREQQSGVGGDTVKRGLGGDRHGNRLA